jgi:hypothetical protein
MELKYRITTSNLQRGGHWEFSGQRKAKHYPFTLTIDFEIKKKYYRTSKIPNGEIVSSPWGLKVQNDRVA